MELGADADGQLTGMRSRVLIDRGSTDQFGVESVAALLASGPYRWRAHELTALGVATNRVTFGAYRAPAAAPAAFAVESLIDELAGRLAIDPLELRLRNVVAHENNCWPWLPRSSRSRPRTSRSSTARCNPRVCRERQ